MGVSLNQFLTKGLVSSSGWHLNLGAYQVDLFTVFALGKTVGSNSGIPVPSWWGHRGGDERVFEPGTGCSFWVHLTAWAAWQFHQLMCPLRALVFYCFFFFFLKNRMQVMQIGKKFGLHSFKRPSFTENKKVLGLALSAPRFSVLHPKKACLLIPRAWTNAPRRQDFPFPFCCVPYA